MELTMKDRQRIEVIQAVMDERIRIQDAAKVLRRSVRQVFRLLRTPKGTEKNGSICYARHGSSQKIL